MKILCGKQRKAVRRNLTIAYRHLQRAADTLKGAYGSSIVRQLYVAPALRDLGSLVDMSHPWYGHVLRGGLSGLLPPASRKLDRMSRMTSRQLGLNAKEVEE